MALTGELSDLSLAELIEFFCNQRKTGRLKVIYSAGPGYFYLQAGSVVHAEIGALRGIDAVYYALTLPNASFKFSTAVEPPEKTINQPWTSVVLEGLRRMDEGIEPGNPFPPDYVAEPDDEEPLESLAVDTEEKTLPPMVTAFPQSRFLSDAESASWLWETESRLLRKQWGLGAVAAAVVMILAAVGIPWGWYARSQSAKAMTQPKTVEIASQPPSGSADVKITEEPPATVAPAEVPSNSEAEAQVAKRARDERAKERVKAQAAASTAATTTASTTTASTTTATTKEQASALTAKKVVVQVSYDENGRVTQASGGDATALRIARQKRFPAGKAGSATITIPIN